MALRIRVFYDQEGAEWRADPVDLSGTPPNGTGPTVSAAVDSLCWQLSNIYSDGPSAGYVSQLQRAGWPAVMIEIKAQGTWRDEQREVNRA